MLLRRAGLQCGARHSQAGGRVGSGWPWAMTCGTYLLHPGSCVWGTGRRRRRSARSLRPKQQVVIGINIIIIIMPWWLAGCNQHMELVILRMAQQPVVYRVTHPSHHHHTPPELPWWHYRGPLYLLCSIPSKSWSWRGSTTACILGCLAQPACLCLAACLRACPLPPLWKGFSDPECRGTTCSSSSRQPASQPASRHVILPCTRWLPVPSPAVAAALCAQSPPSGPTPRTPASAAHRHHHHTGAPISTYPGGFACKHVCVHTHARAHTCMCAWNALCVCPCRYVQCVWRCQKVCAAARRRRHAPALRHMGT